MERKKERRKYFETSIYQQKIKLNLSIRYRCFHLNPPPKRYNALSIINKSFIICLLNSLFVYQSVLFTCFSYTVLRGPTISPKINLSFNCSPSPSSNYRNDVSRKKERKNEKNNEKLCFVLFSVY